MSTTSLPVDARPSAPLMAVKPPLLASDMLREEVAPLAPARRVIRIGLGAFAAVFALAAIGARFGLAPAASGVFLGSVGTALVALLATFLPAPYAARASLAAVAGVLPLLLGAIGYGPLAAIGHEGALQATLGLVMITALPGALLFRARYRAFRAARIILAAVLVACGPGVYFVAQAMLDADASLVTRSADAALLIAAFAAFFGFMGEETTGGCGRSAALVLVVHAARLAAAEWLPATEASPRYGTWGYPLAALGELAASALVAFALFQLLAAAFAVRARKVDVHRAAGASAPHLDRRE